MNKLKTKKILITGALGQDGIILSRLLKNKNCDVLGWIKSTKTINSKINKIKYQKINLLKKKEINYNINNYKPDFVVHFGSNNPSFNERIHKKKDFNSNNKLGCINLINSILDLNLKTIFIFANSSQIYFSQNKIRVNEKSIIKKSSSYTSFRIDVLEYLKKIKKKHNFKFINLSLFNHDSIYRNNKFLIPRLIKAFKNNDSKFLNKIYNENISSDFSHAEDICEAIYLLIKRKILIDNLILSSGKLTKINDIIDYLIENYPNKIILKHKKVFEKKGLIGNNSLSKKILRWKPKKNIYDAVDEIYNLVN